MEESRISQISWKVPEKVYRADPALSYSTIAKYTRTGFNGLQTLFDEQTSPSLTFGSVVDTILTGGMDEFNALFYVAEFPTGLGPKAIEVVQKAYEQYSQQYTKFTDIPQDSLDLLTQECGFYRNYKPENRIKILKENGAAEYYTIMKEGAGKEIISTETFQKAQSAVNALRTSPSTKHLFEKNNPFDGVQRDYQLKFKATIDGVDFRNMADLIISYPEQKHIKPYDLKTSHNCEWDFVNSFIKWQYHQQARLYWRIIRENMDKDPILKDWTLDDYTFIVVNNFTDPHPLTWVYEDTQKRGDLTYGKNQEIVFKDPVEVGKELQRYLSTNPTYPDDIDTIGSNSIVNALNAS